MWLPHALKGDRINLITLGNKRAGIQLNLSTMWLSDWNQNIERFPEALKSYSYTNQSLGGKAETGSTQTFFQTQNPEIMINTKLDMAKAYPEYYKAKNVPQIIDLEPYHYLTIEGRSAPEDPLFHAAIEQAYAVAYGIKFICKAQEMDFVVPKMEAFWWVTGELPFEETPREEWHWKIIFRMPDFVGDEEFKAAVTAALNKGKLSANHQLKFEQIHEGKSAQILHKGSYEEERPTLDKLYAHIAEEGLEICGYHHEIYLNDPRRVAEEKLRTILRYAVK